MLDHETFRNEVWLPNKLFRSQRDNEFHLSSSIKDTKELVQLKKDQDKATINAIRSSILLDQHDKVFTYIDLLNFTQSIKICV